MPLSANHIGLIKSNLKIIKVSAYKVRLAVPFSLNTFSYGVLKMLDYLMADIMVFTDLDDPDGS